MAAMGAAAAAATGGTLYQYNRKNYMYDRKMRMETEYQIMEFKIKKAELFREDVRDIIGLTSVKMDTYLIVNAVQLGFCVMMFCEGRLAAGTPNWLIGCHTLSLAGAFTYLLTSVWLSMHATIAAKSYEVRILTQLVRLPVPSWAQLEGARTYASTFEKLESRQMFRVPFATGSQEGVLQYTHGDKAAPNTSEPPNDQMIAAGAIDGHEADRSFGAGVDINGTGAFSADPWGLEHPGDAIYELDASVQDDPRNLRHIQLVREAMQYWQSYDAFARVAMSIGTNQLVAALSYYVLGYVLISNHAIVAAWLAVVLFVAIACALIRLDMSLTSTEYKIAVLMVTCGPILTAICAREWARNGTDLIVKVLMPIVYVSHTLWLIFILYLSKISEQKNGVQLPTGFRSVLYIDVFGWIKDNPVARKFQGLAASIARRDARIPAPTYGITNAAGPAIQSVRYVDGIPVPMRVEQLPGASRAPRTADISKADFAPDTFVPREKECDEVQAIESTEVDKAGARPWKVFCGATSLLAVLWWMVGMLVTMELLGVDYLRVTPLTRDREESVIEDSRTHPSLLQFGQPLLTKWPHDNIQAFGLACNGASNTVVASSRFGMYTAELSSKSSNDPILFQVAPFCHDVEGESLQDVSLQCGGADGSACQAVVLHQQGQQLAKCDLAKPSKALSVGTAENPAVALISEEWLSDGDSARDGPAEVVQSVAIPSKCSGGPGNCAYVSTSDNRIVELQLTADGNMNRKYFPHRLLQTSLNGTSSGSMDVINDRFLVLLQHDRRHVQVLDLQKGGANVGAWRIPALPKDQKLSSMCAAGDNLYFLTEGQSPQLWRFAVPALLKPSEASKTAPLQRVSEGAELKSTLLLHAAGDVQPAQVSHHDVARAIESTQASVLLQASRHKSHTKHLSLKVSSLGDSSEPLLAEPPAPPAPRQALRR